jgi:general secretion pathway protein A
MYESFFNLREKPFRMPPDPRMIYWSKTHRMAYTMLEYGIFDNLGFTVITGDIGSGKTTLLRRLMAEIGPGVTIGLLNNTQIERGELLRWVMMSLGQPFDQTSRVGLFKEFQNFLIHEYSQIRRTILVVDEAQNLSVELLEELRMLSNINAEDINVLQIILLGQPQLRETLLQPELKQFVQRIGSDFHIHPLPLEEVPAYLSHRISAAGGDPALFEPRAGTAIALASRGVPRVINMLADTSLLYAFSNGSRHVTAATVASVLEDKKRYSPFFDQAAMPQG